MLRDPKTNDLVHTVCIDDKSKLNINNPNLVTADGVQLNLRYKFIYQIEGKEGLYPEVFEYSRLGSEIIEDITSFDKFFRHNKGVDLSSGEHPLSQLRHFLIGKLIVITHTKIKGKGSKVIKSIRKQTGLSTKEINEILKMKKCKKSVETLKSVIGAYMFFKITLSASIDTRGPLVKPSPLFIFVPRGCPTIEQLLSITKVPLYVHVSGANCRVWPGSIDANTVAIPSFDLTSILPESL